MRQIGHTRRMLSRRSGWLAALWLVLPACVGAPVPTLPETGVEAPARFSQSGAEAQADRWWEAFADPRLSAHVGRALTANRALAGLWHAVREGRAVARRSGAARAPTLDLFADGSVDRGTGSRAADETLAAGAALEHEVDLWGRLEAARRADALSARARLDDYHAAALTLSAEVARTWFRLLEAESQDAVLAEQVESNVQILTLIEPRVATQQLRSVDVLRQEALIESTREDRIGAQADAALLRNQLAVLTGQAPGRIPANVAPTLVAVPPLPATGVPIERVRRRPDVLAAAHRAMAGDQEFGAALRDRYPRLNIVASARSSAGVFEQFIATFAGGLLAPVLDGGRRAAEIDRTCAQRDRLRATYAQSVLVAFREIEDALVEEDRQRRRVESLQRQLDLSRQSSGRLRDEYFSGQADYIEVLGAVTTEHHLRRELLTATRLVLEARVDLYQALAGSPATCLEEAPR